MTNQSKAHEKAKHNIMTAQNPQYSREDMRKYHSKGYTFRQIAKIIGCSQMLVRTYLQESGYPNNPESDRGYWNWDEDAFLDLYSQNYNDTEIGKILNVPKSTVGKYRNELGFEPNGINSSMKKHTREQIDMGEGNAVPDVEKPMIKVEWAEKPMSREEWNAKRLQSLQAWIAHKVKHQEWVEPELIKEYMELIELNGRKQDTNDN